MKTVTVPASKKYDVLIGEGLLSALGASAGALIAGRNVCIVSDSHVAPLYAQAVEESLYAGGAGQVFQFVFPAGEASKNGATYLSLLNFLAEHRLTRADCLAALGGGVTGDLTGFAAATYLRGISYIQLPTSLLAAVDSSVGGKTAIDLPAGKNLAGAFCQPSLVVCDLSALDTLPPDVFLDGCGEVVKYGVLYDQALFEHLAKHGPDFHRENVIARCVELKRDVVARDEFDRGERQKLNLGHTIGHGVEALSGYTVSHGRAVAVGMAIAARMSCGLGLCGSSTRDAILEALARFSLPTKTAYDAHALAQAALSDKKRTGGTVNLILPEAIGSCVIRPTPVDELPALIEMGL